MTQPNTFWQKNSEIAAKYNSPLDRQLYCDNPLLKLLNIQKDETVLDIGCGNGGFTVQLARFTGKVMGVDSSSDMLNEAEKSKIGIENISFQEGDAEQLPFADSSYDKALACMVINTLNNPESVKNVFREAYRILKPGGKFAIALAHPLTLDKKTKFRWTEWVDGQTQKNLVPGEKVLRRFVGKDNEVLKVPNYYWPPDVLKNFSLRYGFENQKIAEPKATQDDLQQYPELDEALTKTPFFLLMSFSKPE